MKKRVLMMAAGFAMILIATCCTSHRTDSQPEAAGDTVEVVIPDKN